MKNNTFVWTDLSSYTPLKSIDFYRSIFDWQIHEENQYYLAYNNSVEIVGIYETPDFFKKINMPHFWMNYIKVNELKQVVEKAKKLGGKVEIENEGFYGGRIALLRDPMGAGFTIYQGNKLTQESSKIHGSVIARELHTSDASKVIEFYSQLFDWTIKRTNDLNRYIIYKKNGTRISSILQLNNELKGKFEYWVTIFGVTNLQKTKTQILELGAKEISDEGTRILCTDSLGEAFFYIEELVLV